jgi:hypothetical protein
MAVHCWKIKPREERLRRLVPLLEGSGEKDTLAADPEELKSREKKEMGLGSAEFLTRKGVARKLLNLPVDTDFMFSDIGLKGNDIARLAYEGRIVEPARAAAGFRWTKIKWRTTEIYPFFQAAIKTQDHVGYLKDALPCSLTVANLQPGDHYQQIRRAVLSRKTLLDDNIVRVVH